MVPTPTSAESRASSSSSQTVPSRVERERRERIAPARRSRVLPIRSPIRAGASTVGADGAAAGPVGASGDGRGSAFGGASVRPRTAM